MTTAATFRTPARILIPKLVKSRAAWKAKATQRKAKRKSLEIRIRDLETSRELHRQRAEQLQQQVAKLQQRLDDAPQPAPAPTAPQKKMTAHAAGITTAPSSGSP